MTLKPSQQLETLICYLAECEQRLSVYSMDEELSQLLTLRVAISSCMKSLDKARQSADDAIQRACTEESLIAGLRVQGGWVIKQRERIFWEYPPDLCAAIKAIQKQAQCDGSAQPLVTRYIVAMQASS